jgi:hypothetical protein
LQWERSQARVLRIGAMRPLRPNSKGITACERPCWRQGRANGLWREGRAPHLEALHQAVIALAVRLQPRVRLDVVAQGVLGDLATARAASPAGWRGRGAEKGGGEKSRLQHTQRREKQHCLSPLQLSPKKALPPTHCTPRRAQDCVH